MYIVLKRCIHSIKLRGILLYRAQEDNNIIKEARFSQLKSQCCGCEFSYRCCCSLFRFGITQEQQGSNSFKRKSTFHLHLHFQVTCIYFCFLELYSLFHYKLGYLYFHLWHRVHQDKECFSHKTFQLSMIFPFYTLNFKRQCPPFTILDGSKAQFSDILLLFVQQLS